MKRLVFFIAALFVTSLAMAQPHADITSIGSYNTATIKQCASENWATIVQDLRVSVGNSASITQCCDNSWNNRAFVYQTEYDNTANVKQGGLSNFAQVNQWGRENNVKLLQGGANSQVYITQHPLSFNNIVDFVQIGNRLLATIDQRGSYNDVLLRQGGNDGIVDIDQDGVNNEVYGIPGQYLRPYAYFAGASLDVDQVGTDNKLMMWSGVAGATVDVLQTGLGNTATVYQGAGCTSCTPPPIPPDPRLCCPGTPQ
jgi:hypothetical protein